MPEDVTFTSILRNPHFSQFASIISIPFWSHYWRKRYADVPFWILLENCTRLIKDGYFSQEPGRTQFQTKFIELITALVNADRKLFSRPDDLAWFYETMLSDRALVTMSLLFAMASTRPNYVTPAQIAKATGDSESQWRAKAASGEIAGVTRAGNKQLLVPVMSLRAYGIEINTSAFSDQDEQEQPVEEEEENADGI